MRKDYNENQINPRKIKFFNLDFSYAQKKKQKKKKKKKTKKKK